MKSLLQARQLRFPPDKAGERGRQERRRSSLRGGIGSLSSSLSHSAAGRACASLAQRATRLASGSEQSVGEGVEADSEVVGLQYGAGGRIGGFEPAAQHPEDGAVAASRGLRRAVGPE